MRHQYVVTEPFDPPVGDVPTVRDPDHIVYFRPEAGRPAGRRLRPRAGDLGHHAPLAQARTLFDPDLPRFAESWAGAQKRVPALREIGLAKVVNGPEAFTPDGEFILGETDVGGLLGRRRLLRARPGRRRRGRQGDGRVDRRRPARVRRQRDGRAPLRPPLAQPRATPAPARWTPIRRYYDVVYPHEEHDAGRPLRVSAAYPRLRELGAAFGEKSGWERANWFEVNAADGDESMRPHGWAGRFWSPAIGAECLAARDSAALFDQSSFSKLEVRGAGAAVALSRLCANEIDRAPGTAVYTQLLNPRGGNRGRPDRHAAGRGSLPAGHRHRVRQPRPALDPRAPARRRLGHRR